MPPKIMFARRHRLSGLEFACCSSCNAATRASDAAAGFFARLSPSNKIDELALSEAHKLIGTIAQLAPSAIGEIFNESKVSNVWEKGRDEFYGPKKRIILDGPVTQSLLHAFSAKLGMALYKEHVGHPLPTGGLVFTQHYFNAGWMRDEAQATLSILPMSGELRMGKQSSGKSFNYRYNCDDKSIVGAFCSFSDNLFIRAFAVSDPSFFEPLSKVHLLDPIPPGGLPQLAEIWAPN